MNDEEIRDLAISYGKRSASAYFDNRRGHGGGRPGKVVLTEAKFAAALAVAYEQGRRDQGAARQEAPASETSRERSSLAGMYLDLTRCAGGRCIVRGYCCPWCDSCDPGSYCGKQGEPDHA